jgi:hypothetical protein
VTGAVVISCQTVETLKLFADIKKNLDTVRAVCRPGGGGARGVGS